MEDKTMRQLCFQVARQLLLPFHEGHTRVTSTTTGPVPSASHSPPHNSEPAERMSASATNDGDRARRTTRPLSRTRHASSKLSKRRRNTDLPRAWQPLIQLANSLAQHSITFYRLCRSSSTTSGSLVRISDQTGALHMDAVFCVAAVVQACQPHLWSALTHRARLLKPRLPVLIFHLPLPTTAAVRELEKFASRSRHGMLLPAAAHGQDSHSIHAGGAAGVVGADDSSSRAHGAEVASSCAAAQPARCSSAPTLTSAAAAAANPLPACLTRRQAEPIAMAYFYSITTPAERARVPALCAGYADGASVNTERERGARDGDASGRRVCANKPTRLRRIRGSGRTDMDEEEETNSLQASGYPAWEEEASAFPDSMHAPHSQGGGAVEEAEEEAGARTWLSSSSSSAGAALDAMTRHLIEGGIDSSWGAAGWQRLTHDTLAATQEQHWRCVCTCVSCPRHYVYYDRLDPAEGGAAVSSFSPRCRWCRWALVGVWEDVTCVCPHRLVPRARSVLTADFLWIRLLTCATWVMLYRHVMIIAVEGQRKVCASPPCLAGCADSRSPSQAEGLSCGAVSDENVPASSSLPPPLQSSSAELDRTAAAVSLESGLHTHRAKRHPRHSLFGAHDDCDDDDDDDDAYHHMSACVRVLQAAKAYSLPLRHPLLASYAASLTGGSLALTRSGGLGATAVVPCPVCDGGIRRQGPPLRWLSLHQEPVSHEAGSHTEESEGCEAAGQTPPSYTRVCAAVVRNVPALRAGSTQTKTRTMTITGTWPERKRSRSRAKDESSVPEQGFLRHVFERYVEADDSAAAQELLRRVRLCDEEDLDTKRGRQRRCARGTRDGWMGDDHDEYGQKGAHTEPSHEHQQRRSHPCGNEDHTLSHTHSRVGHDEECAEEEERQHDAEGARHVWLACLAERIEAMAALLAHTPAHDDDRSVRTDTSYHSLHHRSSAAASAEGVLPLSRTSASSTFARWRRDGCERHAWVLEGTVVPVPNAASSASSALRSYLYRTGTVTLYSLVARVVLRDCDVQRCADTLFGLDAARTHQPRRTSMSDTRGALASGDDKNNIADVDAASATMPLSLCKGELRRQKSGGTSKRAAWTASQLSHMLDGVPCIPVPLDEQDGVVECGECFTWFHQGCVSPAQNDFAQNCFLCHTCRLRTNAVVGLDCVADAQASPGMQ